MSCGAATLPFGGYKKCGNLSSPPEGGAHLGHVFRGRNYRVLFWNRNLAWWRLCARLRRKVQRKEEEEATITPARVMPDLAVRLAAIERNLVRPAAP